MKTPKTMPRLKSFRFPREIIGYAVWVYDRFALSTADVEDLLAERGLFVSRETLRQWLCRKSIWTALSYADSVALSFL